MVSVRIEFVTVFSIVFPISKVPMGKGKSRCASKWHSIGCTKVEKKTELPNICEVFLEKIKNPLALKRNQYLIKFCKNFILAHGCFLLRINTMFWISQLWRMPKHPKLLSLGRILTGLPQPLSLLDWNGHWFGAFVIGPFNGSIGFRVLGFSGFRVFRF